MLYFLYKRRYTIIIKKKVIYLISLSKSCSIFRSIQEAEEGARADLYWSVWAGGGRQGPDDVEPGQGAGGEEGAGQHHRLPLHCLHTGFSHCHPQSSCTAEQTHTTAHPLRGFTNTLQPSAVIFGPMGWVCFTSITQRTHH